VPLYTGVVATVAGDHQRDKVVLSLTDGLGASFTIEIPCRAASDLAVALVNAANGL
jgi:hypothetical protein